MMKPVLTTIAVAALAACGDREVVVGEDYQRVLDPLAREIDKLDVLFVIDPEVSITNSRRWSTPPARGSSRSSSRI